MAAFFLLLTILVGVVLGDALVENDSAGTLTLFGQTTERFNDGQLLLVFAGLGFLFALLLVLSLVSTRRRRTRRKELRSGARELGERITELERDNARLQADLAQRDEALAGREAELAHRDRQLALKDEELAGREQELHRAGTRGAQAAPANPSTPAEVVDEPSAPRTEVLDQAGAARVEVFDQAAAPSAEAADQAAVPPAEALDRNVEAEAVVPDLILSSEETDPVAPLHDEPPWLSEGDGDSTRPLAASDGPADRARAGEEPTRLVDRATAPPADASRENPDDRPARSRDEPNREDG